MTDKKKFIIGSRGSKLSLAYSSYVKDLLIKSHSQFDDKSIEIKVIKTSLERIDSEMNVVGKII